MKEILLIVVVIVFFIWFLNLSMKQNEASIREKIDSMGGNDVKIELRVLDHPFWLMSKGDQAYYFTYKLNGKTRDGYVKFGLFDEWRFSD